MRTLTVPVAIKEDKIKESISFTTGLALQINDGKKYFSLTTNQLEKYLLNLTQVFKLINNHEKYTEMQGWRTGLDIRSSSWTFRQLYSFQFCQELFFLWNATSHIGFSVSWEAQTLSSGSKKKSSMHSNLLADFFSHFQVSMEHRKKHCLVAKTGLLFQKFI